MLGIGGVRALRALRLKPTVWHMNEGHAAFLVLERMRALVGHGLAFAERAANASPPTPSSPPTPRCRPATTSSAEDLIWSYFQDFCRELGMSTRGVPGARAAVAGQPRVST